MHQTQGHHNDGMSPRQRFLTLVSAVRSESNLSKCSPTPPFNPSKDQHIMPLLLQNPTQPLLPHVCFFTAPLSRPAKASGI